MDTARIARMVKNDRRPACAAFDVMLPIAEPLIMVQVIVRYELAHTMGDVDRSRRTTCVT